MVGATASELTVLRAQVDALQAQVGALLAERGAGHDAPPGTNSSRAAPPNRPRPQLPRRGILAGVGVLVAGGLTKLASAGRVHAADGGNFILGGTNQANSQTVLYRGAGPPSPSGYALHVFGTGSIPALFADSEGNVGVAGFTDDTTNQYSGVSGRVTFAGVNHFISAGVHGSSTDRPGVIGDSNTGSGVIGLHGGTAVSIPAGSVAGVLGVAPTSIHAVQGVAGGAGPPPPVLTVGVGGYSAAGVGALGSSSSNVGVYGQSTTASGVYGAASTQAGTWGNSTSGPGTGGDSNSGFGLYGVSLSNDGVRGLSTGGVGVRGISANSNGVYGQGGGNNAGVAGFGTGGPGVFGQSNSGSGVFAISTSGTGVYGTSSSGLAGWFVGPVQVNGSFTVVGGPKSAAVPHPDGSHRRLYCVESPESCFEDFGRDRLVNGRAQVRLDPDFAAVVQSDNYDVVLTAGGDTRGLYVNSQTPQGFEVRENQGGTSSVAFAYRVVAKRKDVVGPRLERVAVMREPPALPARPPSATDDAPPIPRPPTSPANAPSPSSSPQPRPGR